MSVEISIFSNGVQGHTYQLRQNSMSECTNVGEDGSKGIPIKIPANVRVFLTGYQQSAAQQTATIKNSSGNVVAEITGSGNPGQMGNDLKYFKSDGKGYKIYLTHDHEHSNRVLYEDATVVSGTTAYTQTWTFITEDTPHKGDCDFNDSVVYVTWNLNSG